MPGPRRGCGWRLVEELLVGLIGGTSQKTAFSPEGTEVCRTWPRRGLGWRLVEELMVSFSSGGDSGESTPP